MKIPTMPAQTTGDDMKTCMDMVRKLHEAGLKVGHSFNIRERISFYEKLCLEHGGIPLKTTVRFVNG